MHYAMTKIKGKNPQRGPKSTPTATNQASQTILISDVTDYCMIWTDFSAVAKMVVYKISEIEKEEVESPVCHLVARKV